MNALRLSAPDAAAIARAAAVLRSGGLVAFPTETVYGLGAAADDPAAVRRIFEAKGRPPDHPIIVHVAAAADLMHWSRTVSAVAQRLAEHFWPGPLTLVLPRSARAHDLITGGQDTVGLRCPGHPWAQALLTAFGGAIAAPSANSFGRISPTTAAHVRADLGEMPGGRIDLILDGGACPVGIESTIVDLSGAAPTLLRPGTISREALAEVTGAPVPDAGAAAPRASGRLESHYAPRTPLHLVSADALSEYVNAHGAHTLALLAPAHLRLENPPRCQLVAPAEPADYARQLYSLLHQLDAAGAERIVVAMVPAGTQWDAIRDRLRRAAVREPS